MSKQERLQMRVASYLILKKEDKVLLLRRFNAGWEDGKYNLPAGHVDPGEYPEQAAIREATEEVNVKANTVELVHIHYEKDRYVDFYFTCEDWSGEPKIMEPEKCDDLKWVKEEDLEDIAMPAKNKKVITKILKNELFSQSEEGNVINN